MKTVEIVKARAICHIKSFLAQHTLFPVQFKFEGVDQLSVMLKGSAQLEDNDIEPDSKSVQLDDKSAQKEAADRIINLKVDT